jgi:hypothetical protein
MLSRSSADNEIFSALCSSVKPLPSSVQNPWSAGPSAGMLGLCTKPVPLSVGRLPACTAVME